uniref:Coiled-coil domain containing 32 n=1 Tax=Oryzias latipes TaxID=8090 RepID=A0A3P9KMZ8_ORYLA
ITMVDDFDNQEVRSSGELWTEICSGLPGVPTETAAENDAEFRDSFYPESLGGDHQNGLTNGTSCSSSSSATWKPMEDSDIYIASLENRLRKIKGQPGDVTSKEILRSLSQAKKECWDRFLHDAQTSELFQGADMDESALEHFKRWLIPEKVAISAEELEFLLRPSQKQEPAEADQMRSKEEPHDSNKDDALSPNRFKAEL